MNLAEIIHYPSGFEIVFNDLVALAELDQLAITITKENVVEWYLNDGGRYADGYPRCTYSLTTGEIQETHAAIVSRGVDSGVTTWFTHDNTSTGTPDTQKLYEWVRDKLMQ